MSVAVFANKFTSTEQTFFRISRSSSIANWNIFYIIKNRVMFLKSKLTNK